MTHVKKCGQAVGPDPDISILKDFMTEQLYEHENHELVRAAFDRMEEFLTTRGQGNRDRIAVELLEAVQNVAWYESFGSEAFARFLGPETKRLWAELQAIWKTSLRLDLQDRTVLEGEVLISRIARQSVH
jgi:hypothetical protein